jgi:hypothetical protein
MQSRFLRQKNQFHKGEFAFRSQATHPAERLTQKLLAGSLRSGRVIAEIERCASGIEPLSLLPALPD